MPIDLADVIHPAHVSVGNLPRVSHLAAKTVQGDRVADHSFGEKLQRDGLPQFQVIRAIDLAHPTASEQTHDPIARAELGAGFKASVNARRGGAGSSCHVGLLIPWRSSDRLRVLRDGRPATRAEAATLGDLFFTLYALRHGSSLTTNPAEIEVRVPRAIDLAHAPCAEGRADLAGPEFRASFQGHDSCQLRNGGRAMRLSGNSSSRQAKGGRPVGSGSKNW